MPMMPRPISAIPPEVLISIANRLDNFSLLMMLQVSKAFYTTLYPLLWIDITKRQWLHTAFPVKDALACDALLRLQRLLFNVRKLEWWDSEVHMMGISDMNLAMFSRHCIKPPNFSQLLQFTPLITSLSLVASLCGSATRRVLESVSGLQYLTKLELCFVNKNAYSMVHIDGYFDLFSRLEELRLSGNWYCLPEDYRTAASPDVESRRAWSINRLCLRTSDVAMVKYCPKLTDLVLSGNFSSSLATSIMPVSICTSLQTLELRHCTYSGRMDDIHAALPSLRCLKSLAMCVNSMEQILCLCPTEDGAILPLPSLQHLKILDTSMFIDILNRAPFTRALRSILVSRSRLLSLSVHGCSVNAALLFSPLGSAGHQHAFWVCKDIQSLQIQLADVNHTHYSLEERQAVSRLIYQQLAQLAGLEVLSVHATDIDIGMGSGVPALTEAPSLLSLTQNTLTGCQDHALTTPLLRKLHSLSLFDKSRSIWTEDHLRLLLSLCPKLHTLTLTRPLKVPGGSVSKWLQEFHPTGITFNSSPNIADTNQPRGLDM